MATEQTLKVVISAVNRTGEAFHQINAQLNAFTAPIRHIGAGLSTLAEETGLVKIGEHARSAFQHVRHLGEGITSLLGPLAALGAAGSGAGLFEMVKSTAEAEGKLYDLSIATGIAGQQLAGWHFAADKAHVGIEQLDKGFERLNKNIALAAMGKAKDVEQILGRMGFHNTAGHLVATSDAIQKVARETKRLVDSHQIQLATAMLSELFGARSGAQLLPLFSQGDADIVKQIQEAIALGIAPSNDDIANGKKFDDNLKEMGASVEGLKFTIGNALMPELRPVILEMTEWVKANRQWLASDPDGPLQTLIRTVKQIDFKRVWEDMKEMGRWAHWAFDEIGGVGGALGLLVAIKLEPLIKDLVLMGWEAGAAAAKFALFPAAAFIFELGRALYAGAGAMGALDAAMDANPIGLVVLGIAALIGIGWELYQNWDWISTKVTSIWNGLPQPVKDAVKLIGLAIMPFLFIPLEIYQHWDELTPYFTALWDGVTAVFKGAWAAIKPIVEALEKAIDWITGHPLLYQALTGVVVPGLSIPLPGAAQAPGAIGAAAPSQYRGFDASLSDFLKAHAPIQYRSGLDAMALSDLLKAPAPALAATTPPLRYQGLDAALPDVLRALAPGSIAPQQSTTKVIVDIKGLPPGSSVSTEHSGSNPADVNVGHAFAW
jgi:hypothetical protein